MPKLPVYPPPDDSLENAEFSSNPDPQISREQISPAQGKPKESDHGIHLMALADAHADMDHFEDTLRQQLHKEINGAPWHQDASHQALEEMEKVVKTVKPVYEGFWHQNDSDILNRLNETAEKLKDRNAEIKQDIIKGTHQQEYQVTPSDKCVTCNHPIGQHLLECSKNTLQHELEEIIDLHEVSVEPLTCLPKIVHPFPVTRPQIC